MPQPKPPYEGELLLKLGLKFCTRSHLQPIPQTTGLSVSSGAPTGTTMARLSPATDSFGEDPTKIFNRVVPRRGSQLLRCFSIYWIGQQLRVGSLSVNSNWKGLRLISEHSIRQVANPICLPFPVTAEKIRAMFRRAPIFLVVTGVFVAVCDNCVPVLRKP
jgi:hypothetical protein